MQYEISNGNELVAIIGSGTNLLTGTSDFSSNWNGQSSVSTTTDYNGYPSMVFTSSSQLLANQPVGELENSFQYASSFWAKADNAGDKAHTELWGSIGKADFVLTTNWVHYTTVLTSYSDVSTNINHSTCFFGVPDGNKGNVYIALPKLEKGSIATPWSPAPGDLGLVSDQHGYQVAGLTPATSYTFSVVSDNGLRKSKAATVTFKTRGVQFIIPETLTVGAAISLRYQEYSLGLVAIGSEPSGMFGGGNQKTLAATVISSSGGSSAVELTTGDTSFADQTKLTKQSNGVYAAFSGYKAIYYG